MFWRVDSALAVDPMWSIAQRWSERSRWVGWSCLEKTTEMPAIRGYRGSPSLFTRVTRQPCGMLLSLPMVYKIVRLPLLRARGALPGAPKRLGACAWGCQGTFSPFACW